MERQRLSQFEMSHQQAHTSSGEQSNNYKPNRKEIAERQEYPDWSADDLKEEDWVYIKGYN